MQEYLMFLIKQNSKIQIFCKLLFMHSIKLKFFGLKFLYVSFIFLTYSHLKLCVWCWLTEYERFLTVDQSEAIIGRASPYQGLSPDQNHL